MATQSFTITMDATQVSRLLDAIAGRYGWDPHSGQTKQQFARTWLQQMLKREIKVWEATAAADAVVPPDITVT